MKEQSEVSNPVNCVSLGMGDCELFRLGYAQMYENSRRSEDVAELVLDARSEGR